MTNLEMEIMHKLLIKYMKEAEENGLIDTFDNTKPEKPDEILKAVKRATGFVYAFMPGKKED